MAATIWFSNYWMVSSVSHKLYTNTAEVPFNELGLLLGTSKFNRSGTTNLFFKYRIQAAADLIKTGKIKHIIVSGDNSLIEYNEPRDMKRALILLGVPDSCITLDFAGFRTFDSVVRSKKVFGQDKITVISQKFHNERALFIADYYAIDAIGFCAKDAPSQYSFWTNIREPLAKFRALIDLYVIKQEPRFLGKKEKINL